MAEATVAPSLELVEFEVDELYFGARRIGEKRKSSSRKNASVWYIKKRWKSICKYRKELQKGAVDTNSRR